MAGLGYGFKFFNKFAIEVAKLCKNAFSMIDIISLEWILLFDQYYFFATNSNTLSPSTITDNITYLQEMILYLPNQGGI